MRDYKLNWKALCAVGMALGLSHGTLLADEGPSGARLTTGSGGGAYLQLNSDVGPGAGSSGLLDPRAPADGGPRLTPQQYKDVLDAIDDIQQKITDNGSFSDSDFNALSGGQRAALSRLGVNNHLQCPPNVKPYFVKNGDNSNKAVAVLDRRHANPRNGSFNGPWNKVTPELTPRDKEVSVAVLDYRDETVHYYSQACNLCTASGVQFGGGYRAAGLGLEGCCAHYRTGSSTVSVPYYRMENQNQLVLAPVFPDKHALSGYDNLDVYGWLPGSDQAATANFSGNGLSTEALSAEFEGTITNTRPVDVNGISGAGQQTFYTQSGQRYNNEPPPAP